VIVTFLLPGVRTRSVWLLLLSVGFYLLLAPRTFVVLAAFTVASYLLGLAIAKARRESDAARRVRRVRSLMWLGVGAAAGVLLGFKYLGWFAGAGNVVFGAVGLPATMPVLRIALPVGISFWTFQVIAYIVDVSKGKTEAVRDPILFALSVMFFPVVTAGPITRVQALVPQLSARYRFDYGCMQSGLLLIGRGFFKKLMVADYLAVFVGTVFANPRGYPGATHGLIFFIAAALFAIQLYCDFSGYSDIVRGSSRLFGVELPVNFRAPHLSPSVREFWRRWHISLMDWLKDYVYIPLGGNRKGRARRYLNLMVVFLVSGMWHGAGSRFLVWGALNGLYQIAEEALAPAGDRVAAALRIDRSWSAYRALQVVRTFVLLSVAWVFFRARSLGDALYMVERMFLPTAGILTDGTLLLQGLEARELVIAAVSFVIVCVADWRSLRIDVLAALNRQHVALRWAVYYTLILSVVVFGRYGGAYSAADFVYYNF
jgi:D-alanyl-lipoteichoic acid acyltransferase DltB (MBOAT superfamily)